jgi:uncharacterized protein
MTKGYNNSNPAQMRRSDRAVTDETWVRRFLNQAAVGLLATSNDNQPYINSNMFAYNQDAHCIYIHGARDGRTPFNIEQNEHVCFSIMEMGRLLPASRAMEFSVEYAGVVVFGKAYRIDGDEAARALQMLMDKYAPHLKPSEDYHHITEKEVKQTSVFRIDIEHWSGKKKEAAADFPGAYWHSDEGMLDSVKNNDNKVPGSKK